MPFSTRVSGPSNRPLILVKVIRIDLFSSFKIRIYSEPIFSEFATLLNAVLQFMGLFGSNSTNDDHNQSNRASKDYQNAQKPEDQLVLTSEELEEDIAKILTTNNPDAPHNIVVYSFKERKFKATPHVDQTYIHFEIKGNLILKDSEEAKVYETQKKNRQLMSKNLYSRNLIDEYVDSNGVLRFRILKNGFNYIDRSAQCFVNPTREVGINTEPPLKVNFSGLVNQYVLFEVYSKDYEQLLKSKEKRALSRYERIQTSQRRKMISKKPQQNDINIRMLTSTRIIERMISQNSFDDIMQDFKYYEDLADSYKSKEGTLLPLWRFSNEASRKKCVTCLRWNQMYCDLFGIAIGSYNFLEKTNGCIIFYSLKNPAFYEYRIETESGCMSIDINPESPYLIAAGFYDGSVAVYDLRDKILKSPKYSSTLETGKHFDPVWQVQWLKDDNEGNKNFCSISSDGRVINWTIDRKSLHPIELTRIKETEINEKQQKHEIIGSGTCFDFNTKPDDLYLVGTEDGKVLEYSRLYSNHLLTVFNAHSMPIYSIKWNPYLRKVFITCSADWKVKIWDHRYEDPIFIFEFNSPVGDVEWAPYSSTVFAAVTSDGNIHIYDINVDITDPICVQNITNKRKRKLTRVSFNPIHPVLIVSDDKGVVSSFKLSPNLRSIARDSKNNPITIINKPNFEISKLTSLIALERINGQATVKTTRRHFNFDEKTIKIKTNEEKEEEERDKEKEKENKLNKMLAINDNSKDKNKKQPPAQSQPQQQAQPPQTQNSKQ